MGVSYLLATPRLELNGIVAEFGREQPESARRARDARLRLLRAVKSDQSRRTASSTGIAGFRRAS
jgi:hypothetical protein